MHPLPWTDYFTQECYLKNTRCDETVIHHLYLTPPAPKGPLFVLHHGAGSSGLSFALFAAELRRALPNCGVMSIDARGHGGTVVKSPQGQNKGEPHDLSLDLLSSDLSDSVKLLQAHLGWPQLPDLVLVGHSLGGPIVTDVASKCTLGSSVLGYAVLDVVEGTKRHSLNRSLSSSRRRLRNGRPTKDEPVPRNKAENLSFTCIWYRMAVSDLFGYVNQTASERMQHSLPNFAQ